ncbi:MAG: lytic murein transglycosylase B [Alteromonadaceae bacterium]|nr:MAG: lytic murein transglycosylase B [Alteromonadaceae bacterium]
MSLNTLNTIATLNSVITFNTTTKLRSIFSPRALSRYIAASGAACLLTFSSLSWSDYSQHALAEDFVKTMVEEHQFDAEKVRGLLSEATKKQSILDAMSRPAEKTKAWHEYRKIFLGKTRIDQGVEFWQKNQQQLSNASAKYGVPESIIVSIIGVETRYGRHAGKYRVIDALSTLAFDYPKRAKFFRKELVQFLLLTQEQKIDPLDLKGSYAGAMGYGQFMPSSYRAYAVDFDGDEKADIWKNETDVIGSVANYFKRHHWKAGQPVVERARISKTYTKSMLNSRSKPKSTLSELNSNGYQLVNAENTEKYAASKAIPLSYQGVHGTEFWIGFNNFYVITRYNRSHMYALAVWQLSEEIAQSYQKTSKAEQTTSAQSPAPLIK